MRNTVAITKKTPEATERWMVHENENAEAERKRDFLRKKNRTVGTVL